MVGPVQVRPSGHFIKHILANDAIAHDCYSLYTGAIMEMIYALPIFGLLVLVEFL